MIVWESKYETGHPQIDREHKALIQQLNDLEVAMTQRKAKEHVTELLVFLEKYTREHFRNEEHHFRCYNCPVQHENRKEHQKFINLFMESKERLLAEGTSSVLAIQIHRELVTWVRSHILKIDCQFQPHASKN